MTIELYSTGIPPDAPFENGEPDDEEFLQDFDTIEEAVGWADANGCGWYLWSTPEDGRYLGTIRIVQGSKPEIHEF